jgi:hypothetical protein
MAVSRIQSPAAPALQYPGRQRPRSDQTARFDSPSFEEHDGVRKLHDAEGLFPQCGDAEESLNAFMMSMLRCVDIQNESEKTFDKLSKTLAPAYAEHSKMLTGQLGNGGSVDQRMKQSAAESELRRKSAMQVRGMVDEEMRQEAEERGAACAQAGIDAQKAIKRMRLRATAYQSMTADSSFGAAIKRDQLRQEIEGKGVEYLYDQYATAHELGDDALCAELEIASEPWLRKLATEDRSKQTARRSKETGRTDDAKGTYQKVLALLNAFTARREAKLPPEIRMAEQVFSRLMIPAFISILGVSAWDLSPGQMSAIYSGAPTPGDLQIFDGWHLRTLPKTI